MEQQNNAQQSLNTVQTFYWQVKKLQEIYSLYKFSMMQITLASKNSSEVKITAEDKHQIPEYSKQIKQLAINTYITLLTLNEKMKKPVIKEEIHDIYVKAIETEFLVQIKPCMEYITILNTFIADNIIKDNIIDSQDIFDEISGK